MTTEEDVHLTTEHNQAVSVATGTEDSELYIKLEEPTCCCCFWNRLKLLPCLLAMAAVQILFGLVGITAALFQFTDKHHNLTIWHVDHDINASQPINHLLTFMSQTETYVGIFLFSLLWLSSSIILIISLKRHLKRLLLTHIIMHVLLILMVTVAISFYSRMLAIRNAASDPNERRYYSRLLEINASSALAISCLAFLLLISDLCCAIRSYSYIKLLIGLSRRKLLVS